MIQAINNKVQQSFSASAARYDIYASLHREIADKLLDEVAGPTAPSAILDVGCGTGYLTIKAKERFLQSKVIGLDFAQGMLDVASTKHKDIKWVLADSNNLPFASGCFDLVISNLSYQWSENLSRAFAEAKRVLVPKGVLACTIFGYNTCHELFQSLDEASGRALGFVRLPDQVKIREALILSGFKDLDVDHTQITIEFKDMFELINWFKFIGAPHLPREGHLGAKAISKAALIYKKKFSYQKGIGASFEVIKVYAKK